MKFFIVVLFAINVGSFDGSRDMFVFTEPTYTDQTQCEADITDPKVYPGLVQKLVLEYKQFKRIESVICIEEKELRRALQGIKESSA
tara:strand:+ start:755 stop:1015 length:261 start_codon:yes stop_codon:yes gene_type:complete